MTSVDLKESPVAKAADEAKPSSRIRGGENHNEKRPRVLLFLDISVDSANLLTDVATLGWAP